MLAFRIIAAVAFLLLVLVVGSFLWTLAAPAVGSQDAVAGRRINETCAFATECRMRLSDLFDGDWDTFYEFGPQVPQSVMDDALGRRRVLARAGDRLLVFTKGGRIKAAEYAKDGTGKPLEGEIEFEGERYREQRSVMYRRNTWMRIQRFPVDASDPHQGNYFVLSAEAPE
jgi:hypothetical protein